MKQFVIALGMFDGVHLGHRALLARAAELARADGDTAVVFTYLNHPREVFSGSFDYVSTLEQRTVLCRSAGIDRIDAVPFTKAFSEQSPETFIQMLMARYNGRISTIVCGYDFRFGHAAKGDGALLRALGEQLGFHVEVLDPVLYLGEPCSSTRVREALKDGDLDAANAMLARPYLLTGPVVHNKALGRTFGYPTANVDPGKQILPKDGVYATALLWNGKLYPAVTNIGSNPTVGGERCTVETHVPDANLELYGKAVSILFLKRLRGEVRFRSTELLTEQIGRDVLQAKKVFAENEKSVYNFANLW